METIRERDTHIHTCTLSLIHDVRVPHPHAAFPRCSAQPLPQLLRWSLWRSPFLLHPSERAAVTTGFRESPHLATGLVLSEALFRGTHQNRAQGFTEAGCPAVLGRGHQGSCCQQPCSVAVGPGTPMGSIILVARQGSDGNSAFPQRH